MDKVIIEFKLDEQDFLAFQLFTASQSKIINRRKISGWVTLTLISLVIALGFYFKNNIFMATYSGIVAIVCGLLYPTYFKWWCKKYYRRYIKERYYNRFGLNIYIEIGDKVIFTKDKTGESRINLSEVEKIDEISRYFFIKISTGEHLIIPKYKIQNANEVRAKFESLNLPVNKIVNTGWK